MTVGCSPNPPPYNFCPGSMIGEWETLVWMAKAPKPGGFFWDSYHPVPRGSTYTLRDEQNRVVTEMTDPGTGAATATLSVSRDNAFLGNLLVASNSSGAWTYSASDHLGSPRVVWNNSGQFVESHRYWPYGEDTNTVLPNQRLAFCLMERDTESSRFYDHARNHDFNFGRFVTVDRVGGNPRNPQTWNRYTYSGNNPLKLIDSTGMWVVGATPYHDQIAHAYANSPTFRQVYDAQNHNPQVIQRLRTGLMTGNMRGATIGTHFVPQRGADGTPLYSSPGHVLTNANVSVTTLPPGSGASAIGHELKHGFELFKYGDIRLAPTARENTSSNVSNTWETQAAQDVGAQVNEELNAPGADKTLTPEQEMDVFGPSQQYDLMSTDQKKQCETDPGCLDPHPR